MSKICLGFQKYGSNRSEFLMGYKKTSDYVPNVQLNPGFSLNTINLGSYSEFPPVDGSIFSYITTDNNTWVLTAQKNEYLYPFGWIVVYKNKRHLIYMDKDKNIILKELPYPDEPYEIELYFWELDNWESTCTKTTAHLTPQFVT